MPSYAARRMSPILLTIRHSQGLHSSAPPPKLRDAPIRNSINMVLIELLDVNSTFKGKNTETVTIRIRRQVTVKTRRQVTVRIRRQGTKNTEASDCKNTETSGKMKEDRIARLA